MTALASQAKAVVVLCDYQENDIAFGTGAYICLRTQQHESYNRQI